MICPQAKEALKVCPELVCVHVETIGGGGGSAHGDAATAGDGGAGQDRRRLTEKACLERYR